MIHPSFPVAGILLFILMTGALITDLRTHKIYNKWTFPFMLIGLILNIFYPSRPQILDFPFDPQSIPGALQGFLFSMEGAALGLFLMYLPFHFNVFGGGDVKLLMAAGSLLGPDFAFWNFLFLLAFGALLSLYLMLRRGIFSERMQNAWQELYYKNFGARTLEQTPDKGKALYGIAIFMGAAAAWIKLNWTPLTAFLKSFSG
ncbi:MAG: hypothetical protein CVV64_08445 [Candidatus Wallbacteria bacterium HGW-Wallbacteria-1]|uniref:Prepilin type IV endopeptidase peptidase domain-containing protein n=1 Tax=Candidatus Wallbacteria bacterium HGW-Wallbacteria-1 TaxID=2013854 RepID=A0A2N1PPW4_9BACT|nr:MAG: hypothetical protein CVV64_08445 [Candidatus Wallbacteria bacterium HGW-Wallbacteria-1]